MSGQVYDFNNARLQGEATKGITADEIRLAITARAREFVEWIFPCAVVHKSGRYAVVGDIYGQPGESLEIHLSGPRAGMWKDWASQNDKGGDLIGLFLATNNFTSHEFPRALEIINSEFLNNTAPAWTRKFTVQFKERAAEHADKPRPNIDDRGIPVETYIYRDLKGGIIGTVKRHERDEIDPETGKPKKDFSVWDAQLSKAQAPTPRPLYRLPEIVQHHELVFTEGERKADALASVGVEATCIMFGSNAPLEKIDWTYLAGKKITIWPDKDKSGMAFADRLAPFLINLKCQVFVIIPPADKPNKWDAYDCLAEGGDVYAVIATAQPFTSEAKQESTADVFKLYTLEELEDLPPPKPLIDGIIYENTICLLWAGSDSYKTFVGIDFSFCIGSGCDWHGHKTQAGFVVYVAAEDIGGVTKRMIGWRESKGKDKPKANVRLLNDSFTMASPDADKLIRSIAALPQKPKLIVVDTLAKAFGVGNEDKTVDMNAFVNACDKVRRETGATVLIIHHTGRNAEQERGNAALRGGSDTIITIKKVGTKGRFKLINQPPKGKQKNAEPFKDIDLRTQKIYFEHRGLERSTLVIMSDDGAPLAGEPVEEDETQDPAPRLGQVEKSILAALDKAARSDRSTLGFISLYAAIGGDKGSFGRSLRKLVEKGLVDEVGEGTKNKMYAIRSGGVS